MTRALLIRHAHCHGTGEQLHGRAAGVKLDELGRRQAHGLAERLATRPLRGIYTSPVQRAVETAAAIAARHTALQPIPLPAFDELDFGAWTGRAIDGLREDATWTGFNSLRSVTRAPGGELMLETQSRAVAGLLELREQHAGEEFAVVSHADVLRSMIAHVLGMSLDHVLRLEIAPASVSIIDFHGAWPQLTLLNWCEDEPRDDRNS